MTEPETQSGRLPLQVLALQPWDGGSHRVFLDNWQRHSRHDFTLLTLPAYKWKWRMRHSPLTFASEIQRRVRQGDRWDVLFCTDMLPLAELLGLTVESVRQLPTVIYFHENQLTYPDPSYQERDHHFAFTNIESAIAANAVWFNSDFHRQEFFRAADAWLRRMPDFAPLPQLTACQDRAHVVPPGIAWPDNMTDQVERQPGPLRILWAARWEHDKGPNEFFEAMRLLRSRVPFELYVAGESFRTVPEVFQQAEREFADQIRHWGYVESAKAYQDLLSKVDVAVSTAHHEFFGMAIAEAAAAGAIPIVPKRLAYPEVFLADSAGELFYDGDVSRLIDKLTTVARHIENRATRRRWQDLARTCVAPYRAELRAAEMDRRLIELRQATPSHQVTRRPRESTHDGHAHLDG